MLTLLTPQALDNPLREGLDLRRTPEPCIFVLFGATGDLANRKLYAALFNLLVARSLPGGFAIVGVARRPISDDEFREQVRESVEKHARNKPSRRTAAWETFSQGLFYVQSEFDDAQGYVRLAERLEEVDHQRGTLGNRLFYLSTPPDFYPAIVQHLGETGLAGVMRVTPSGDGHRTGPLDDGHDARHAALGTQHSTDPSWKRIVVEKPFGHDFASAQQLNREISEVFPEERIFRIDHYLGKETVQNILVFRFANGIFEPIWSRRYVDHVQITVAESLGVEMRGGYYDEAGALRDMVPNHLFQLLTLTAMEPPSTLAAHALHHE